MSHPIPGRTYEEDGLAELQREWYHLMRRTDNLHQRLQDKQYILAEFEAKDLSECIQAFVKQVNGRNI
jgi:hypothetical protein